MLYKKLTVIFVAVIVLCFSACGEEQDAADGFEAGTIEENSLEEQIETGQETGLQEQSVQEEADQQGQSVQEETVTESGTAEQRNLPLSFLWGVPDGNQFYEFNDNGTGRIIDTGLMSADTTFKYKIEQSAVIIETESGNSSVWNYSDGEDKFYVDIASSDEEESVIEKAFRKDVYSKWANSIKAYSEYGLENWMSQSELNAGASEVYGYWDVLLNEVYQYLKKVLPKAEFEILKQEELEWVAYKEAAIDEGGKMYEGGSAEPMARCFAGADVTEERVYELINMIPE